MSLLDARIGVIVIRPTSPIFMLSSRLRIRLKTYTHAAVLRVALVVRFLSLWVWEVEGWFNGQ